MFFSPSQAFGQLGGLVGRAVHGVHQRHEGVVRLVEDPAALLDVVAVEAYDERLGRLVAEDVQRADDAVGDLVTGGDAAEDVDEDRLDLRRRGGSRRGRWPSPRRWRRRRCRGSWPG